MNGIHDMGGMDGMGPVVREENEPVFHEPWEGRVYGLGRAIGRWGRGRNWGSFRCALESLPPADYLRLSYYERWFTVHVNRLLASGLVTREELDRGYANSDAAPPELLPATEAEAASLGSGLLDTSVNARFRTNDEGPVFQAPWQAQAFALAVKLSEAGHFTWKEWAETLAAELRGAAERGEPDDGSRYYHHWVAALERIATRKGLTDIATLLDRKEAWADAYRHTPHGKPVELRVELRNARNSG